MTATIVRGRRVSLEVNGFNGLPLVTNLEDGERDRLERDLVYVTRDGLWTIVVPAGFVTDYASVPRVLWNVIPNRGRYNRGAIVHDWLFQAAPIDPRTGAPVTLWTANAILREACERLHVAGWATRAIWAGVTVGGWAPWLRYRRGSPTSPTSNRRGARNWIP